MSTVLTITQLAEGEWVALRVNQIGSNQPATAIVVDGNHPDHRGMVVHLRQRLGFLRSMPMTDVAKLRVGSLLRADKALTILVKA
jgi:hypothetical protein